MILPEKNFQTMEKAPQRGEVADDLIEVIL